MSSMTAAAPARVLADLVPGARVRDAVLVLAATSLLIVAGQIAIPLPFTPVPLSLATFAVLLTGAALGPWRGSASVVLYLALGLAGLPVFADQASGWAFASFGYIVGYSLATILVGVLAQRRADRRILSTMGLSALGSLAIYAVGVPWLAVFLGVDLGAAVVMGAVPFLIGDLIKVVAASALLPSAWKLVGRSRGK